MSTCSEDDVMRLTVATAEQEVSPGSTASLRLMAIVFASVSFISAFLLFQVQLIVSKYILPWFGGSAAVWTTSMLVFQVLLLGGYCYSHLISERLSYKAQGRLHLVLLSSALLLVIVLSLIWPSAITPGSNWKPQANGNPILEVMAILLVSAGLPFFVLSTTGPLLQRWFAARGADAKAYRLYAVSNLGSLLGLLSFPFLLEPALRMRSQGMLWAALFVAFVVGCAWCAWDARSAACAQEHPASKTEMSIRKDVTATTRLLWFLLAACSSALLLATTNLLCQEITSIPLLWVLPLSLYLLSFILCFDHPRWYRRELWQPLLAIGIFAFCAVMHFALRTPQVIVMPILLFAACMTCHGELVRLRPSVNRLTSFYLSISAGGAVGGVFVAIIAPRVFRFFTEFQLSLAACVVLLLWCLFLDEHSWVYKAGIWPTIAVSAGVFAVAYAGEQWIASLSQTFTQYRFYPLALLIAALALVIAYMQRVTGVAGARGFRAVQVPVIVLAVGSLVLLYQTAQPEPGLYMGMRNFYGALRVYELDQGGKAMFHGQTLHGAQLNPPNNRLPMAYYGPDSGIGILLTNHPKRAEAATGIRIGIVGLGAGTLAAYGRPEDYLRYYEINPDVVDLSLKSNPVFTYIQDSPAKVDVQLGDARLLLEREVATGNMQNFDVLVLDAFSGDAVPVHLLTKEAFESYWQQLAPGGIIAIHVSSRHINLMPVIEGLAEHYNAALLVRFANADYPFLDNLWVFMAHRPEDLHVDGLLPASPPLPNNIKPRLWTDSYSDIIRLLY